jgi:hypothetical protein
MPFGATATPPSSIRVAWVHNNDGGAIDWPLPGADIGTLTQQKNTKRGGGCFRLLLRNRQCSKGRASDSFYVPIRGNIAVHSQNAIQGKRWEHARTTAREPERRQQVSARRIEHANSKRTHRVPAQRPTTARQCQVLHLQSEQNMSVCNRPGRNVNKSCAQASAALALHSYLHEPIVHKNPFNAVVGQRCRRPQCLPCPTVEGRLQARVQHIRTHPLRTLPHHIGLT